MAVSAPALVPRMSWTRARPLAAGAALLALGAIVAAVFVAGNITRSTVAERLRIEAEARVPAALAALRGELEKHRAIPLILREDPSLRDALRSLDEPELRQLDQKLERLAQVTRATVLYVLDNQGLTVAASNWREPTSFVGNDYRFRDYYARARETGTAEQYALGTVSRRPGVYFSARVDDAGGQPLGIVVVKLELDAVEDAWRGGGQPVFVADDRGIVVATSNPDWRFHTIRPIPEAEKGAIRESLQYGEAPLTPLDLRDDPLAGFVRAGNGEGIRRFAQAQAEVPDGLAGWRLHLLVPANAQLRSATALAQVLTAMAMTIVLASAFLLMRRSVRFRRLRQEEERAAADLEARVTERTQDLANANSRLTAEIAEREKAEERVATLRDDLAQANRLATLGQVTAGVAHEINQPLAAIRTYAENATFFIEQGRRTDADANLRTVVGLTERIATITDTLRTFSRRARMPLERVAIDEVVDGAMLILKGRIRETGVRIERRVEGGPATIMGGRIRLEQVLVNILRNAIEALEPRRDGRVSITIENAPQIVRITVADNGPGIAPDMLATLFTPFRTSKERGTGLGLVIASDIVTELGGQLAAHNRDEGGAEFVVTLPSADAPKDPS